jgi:hypothetical protein
MSVKHVAWLRFKESVAPERVENHMTACRSLAGRVPAVASLECGASFTDRAGGFTHCIIVCVRDRASLSEYLNHPAHVPIAEALKADLAELRVMDIEV